MTAQFETSFREWIRSVSKPGFDGHGNEMKYVPASQLFTYWSAGHLHEIIDAINPVISVPYETITKQYLGVFSTLVDIGKPEAIRLFLALGMNDDRLPLRDNEIPDEWNHELDDFLQKQWPFCPWRFNDFSSDQRHLPPQQILPIRYEKSPPKEDLDLTEAQVRVVFIDKEYCHSVPEKVVFKIFKGTSTQQLYKREADVYTRLRAFSDSAITECYGSLGYPATNKWIIILEHSEIGSLVDFFKTCKVPVEVEDYKTLWQRLLNLFQGLHLVHNLGKRNLESLTGIHQDIQPSNILVFSRSGSSPYDVMFKLADFGLTEVVRRPEGDESATVSINTEGNRMYSAPEAYTNDRIASELRPRLSPLADLWSLGAVFSDFLVWSIGGEEYRDKYRRSRRDAVAELPHFEERGYGACFHNMIERLPEVDSFHEDILTHKRTGDFLSPCMSEFIFTYMMVDSTERLSALVAKAHAKRMIADAKRSPKPHRSGTPDSNHPSNLRRRTQTDWSNRRSGSRDIQRRDSAYNGEEKVNVKDVYDQIKKKGAVSTFLKKRGRLSEAGMNLSGMQRARNKVNARSGREQIFVIDDYRSMEPYKTEVAMTARVISYTVKVSDKNGMDLYFTSDSVKHQSSENSSYIEDSIKNKWTVSGFCDMKKCLKDVMEGVEDSGMKPTSIYIFTDGFWDPEHDPEVDKVIHDSIERLVKNGKEPEDLMFQFIQFGDNDTGHSRLKYLDDGCTVMKKGVKYDIVDTKHWEDHVPRIIIGSLDRHNDDD